MRTLQTKQDRPRLKSWGDLHGQPYVPALLALFKGVAEIWPDYGDLPALEPHLYPEKRAARERNRPRPVREA